MDAERFKLMQQRMSVLEGIAIGEQAWQKAGWLRTSKPKRDWRDG